VPDGTRLLAPRVYARAGRDSIAIRVPRRGAIVYGGPGADFLSGPYKGGRVYPVPERAPRWPWPRCIRWRRAGLGGPGNDDMTEIHSPSRILAGAGADEIYASDRADVIHGGPGRDQIFADSGTDVIRTLDGQIDTVHCGGRDSLTADGRDEADSETDGPFDECERLNRRGAPRPTPLWFDEWEGKSYVTVFYGCPPDGPGSASARLRFAAPGASSPVGVSGSGRAAGGLWSWSLAGAASIGLRITVRSKRTPHHGPLARQGGTHAVASDNIPNQRAGLRRQLSHPRGGEHLPRGGDWRPTMTRHLLQTGAAHPHAGWLRLIRHPANV
jgi:hypothetical protein